MELHRNTEPIEYIFEEIIFQRCFIAISGMAWTYVRTILSFDSARENVVDLALSFSQKEKLPKFLAFDMWWKWYSSDR